jgi:hypothetical protein
MQENIGRSLATDYFKIADQLSQEELIVGRDITGISAFT